MRPNALSICFRFEPAVSFDEVEGTLELARLSAISLHGPERVMLEAVCDVDHVGRVITIETTTDVGRALSAVFLGLATREFGRRSMRVERSPQASGSQSGGVS